PVSYVTSCRRMRRTRAQCARSPGRPTTQCPCIFCRFADGRRAASISLSRTDVPHDTDAKHAALRPRTTGRTQPRDLLRLARICTEPARSLREKGLWGHDVPTPNLAPEKREI